MRCRNKTNKQQKHLYAFPYQQFLPTTPDWGEEGRRWASLSKKWCWYNINTLAIKCHPGNFTQENYSKEALRPILLNTEIHSNNILFQMYWMEDSTVALTQEVWGEVVQSYRGIKVWKWFKVLLNSTSTQSLVTLAHTLCMEKPWPADTQHHHCQLGREGNK